MFGSDLAPLQTHSSGECCVKAAGAQKDEVEPQLSPGVCRDTVCAGVCRRVEDCGTWVFSCKDLPISTMPAVTL